MSSINQPELGASSQEANAQLTPASQTPYLVELPAEVLQNVAKFISVNDLRLLALTCKDLLQRVNAFPASHLDHVMARTAFIFLFIYSQGDAFVDPKLSGYFDHARAELEENIIAFYDLYQKINAPIVFDLAPSFIIRPGLELAAFNLPQNEQEQRAQVTQNREQLLCKAVQMSLYDWQKLSDEGKRGAIFQAVASYNPNSSKNQIQVSAMLRLLLTTPYPKLRASLTAVAKAFQLCETARRQLKLSCADLSNQSHLTEGFKAVKKLESDLLQEMMEFTEEETEQFLRLSQDNPSYAVQWDAIQAYGIASKYLKNVKNYTDFFINFEVEFSNSAKQLKFHDLVYAALNILNKMKLPEGIRSTIVRSFNYLIKECIMQGRFDDVVSIISNMPKEVQGSWNLNPQNLLSNAIDDIIKNSYPTSSQWMNALILSIQITPPSIQARHIEAIFLDKLDGYDPDYKLGFKKRFEFIIAFMNADMPLSERTFASIIEVAASACEELDDENAVHFLQYLSASPHFVAAAKSAKNLKHTEGLATRYAEAAIAQNNINSKVLSDLFTAAQMDQHPDRARTLFKALLNKGEWMYTFDLIVNRVKKTSQEEWMFKSVVSALPVTGIFNPQVSDRHAPYVAQIVNHCCNAGFLQTALDAANKIADAKLREGLMDSVCKKAIEMKAYGIASSAAGKMQDPARKTALTSEIATAKKQTNNLPK